MHDISFSAKVDRGKRISKLCWICNTCGTAVTKDLISDDACLMCLNPKWFAFLELMRHRDETIYETG
jgi:rubrerythrin